jgi:hypothetical protein
VISVSDVASKVLASQSIQLYCRIQSWLGDTLLADDVPISAGAEDLDATLRVPERVTISVPAVVDGVSWVPATPTDPLSWFGQRLVVQLGIGLDGGQIEWLNRGEFLINSADTDTGTVNVEALGLLQLVDEAVLMAEYQPSTGSQFGDILRDLLLPGIGVNDDAAPTDRAPGITAVSWSDNRLDCVIAALKAWPAQGVVDQDGQLVIMPVPAAPTSADVVLVLTDGVGGTIITPKTSGSRDGLFNYALAVGQFPDSDKAVTGFAPIAGAPIYGSAYVTDPESPLVVGGDFSPYYVPVRLDSPLLTTQAQTQAAAKTLLARTFANATSTVVAECVPNPTLQTGDVVSVTSKRLGLDGSVGTIQALTLPYLPGDSMSLTIVIGA